MATIYEVLRKDHKQINQWLAELETEVAASDVEGVEPTKTRTFDLLAHFLSAHSKAEGEVFYQRLIRKKESAESACEGQIEHELVESLLNSMQHCDRGMRWNAYFKVLKEMVQHHIEEEESMMFDRAKQVLSDEEAENIGTEMEVRRGQLPDIEKRVRGASLLHGSKLHG